MKNVERFLDNDEFLFRASVLQFIENSTRKIFASLSTKEHKHKIYTTSFIHYCMGMSHLILKLKVGMIEIDYLIFALLRFWNYIAVLKQMFKIVRNASENNKFFSA